MYGAMREHAPQSTRLAGAITAATMTVAFGYAMANGMGAYIADRMPDALIYVAMPDTHVDPLDRLANSASRGGLVALHQIPRQGAQFAEMAHLLHVALPP